MIVANAETEAVALKTTPVGERPLRVAVVGCGAIAREFHLPVLAGHSGVQLAALVDRDGAAAAALARAYGVPGSFQDAADLDPADVDAAVIATPPGHHAACARQLLGRGIHVFVEKPMAVTPAEAAAMVAAAQESRTALAAGYFRRLFPSSRLLRAAVAEELLGRPLAFDVEEGHVFDWASVTLGSMRRESAGGGVLIDTGSHTLDQLLSFFPGPFELLDFQDDSLGGIEAECVLRLRLLHRGTPVEGRVTLSRTRRLRNSFRVECERGVLELPTAERHRVTLTQGDGLLEDAASARPRAYHAQLGWDGPQKNDPYEPFRQEIDDWLQAIRTGKVPYLDGSSALSVVSLIEECYCRRRPLKAAWTGVGPEGKQAVEGLPAVHVNGRKSPGRVLITGASGLIGCRTAEVLSQRDGWEVRALVHNPGGASRLARLGVDMVQGDLRRREDLERAVAGCDAVVHCAYGRSGGQRRETFQATVGGTRDLARAAHAAGVRRFVHLSTLAVHGYQVEGVIDEATPVRPRSDDYAKSKAKAERVLAALAREGLAAVVLRLGNVYGPFSSPYTIRPVQLMAAGVPVLLGEGDTPSNTVYVDNVVAAIDRALTAPAEAVRGETFAITDGDSLSWADFHRYYSDGLELPLRAVPVEEFERRRAGQSGWGPGRWFLGWFRALAEVCTSQELVGLGKKVLRTDPLGAGPRWVLGRFPGLRGRLRRILHLDRPAVYRPEAARPGSPPVDLLEMFACRAPVRIDKARRQLGYEPPVSRDLAMALTLEWVRYARLIPEARPA
jgi:predicted dehydrogenase/nucleoside-diphosphate-sugar epimerase